MRGVRIDFSGRRPPPSAWSLAIFMVGAMVCISAAWRLGDLSIREGRATADVNRAQVAAAARRPAASTPVALPEAKIAAINSAITQLNLPWQPLFRSIEGVKPKNVALLGLEPDGKKRVLRILAETKQPEDMIDFVRLIREQPQLADATLIKHETNMQDPNRPIRFLVEAVWKATL